MITVHCLEGRIAFTADGTRELAAGHWLYLAGSVPHRSRRGGLLGAPDGDVPLTAGPPEGPSESSQPEVNMSVPRPKLSEVIDVRTAGAASPGAPSSTLAKTATLEVRRLTLAKGREVPTHHARGEITVHCLEGRIAFTADGTTRELGAGQMLVLAAGGPIRSSAWRTRRCSSRRSSPPTRRLLESGGPPRNPRGQAMRKLTVRIKRYNPGRTTSPRWENYPVEADPTIGCSTCCSAIKWVRDDTRALRYSCTHGVCGSDATRMTGPTSCPAKRCLLYYRSYSEPLVQYYIEIKRSRSWRHKARSSWS